MRLNIQIRTPVWTGNIDSKSEVLQSTGIMGSLRWWTEAILRGMDRCACDPAADDDRCPDKGTIGNKRIHYCPACLIFGATGIRRLFKLEIGGGERIFNGGTINIKPDGRNRGWYLGSGLKGQIGLRIIALDRDFNENLLLLPLIITSNWGALGARTQHGYGVFDFTKKVELKVEDFKEALDKILKPERLESLNIEERRNANNENTNNELPNLKEMFFAKVQFKVQGKDWWNEVDGVRERRRKGERNYYEGYTNDGRMVEWVNSGSVPIAPAIKNWLRFGDGKSLWQTEDRNKDKNEDKKNKNNDESEGIENWLFGTTERICSDCYSKVNKDRNNSQSFWCPNCSKSLKKEDTNEGMASKINISCAYKIDTNLWEFRIWGWIPRNNLTDGFDREGFLNNLKGGLSGNGSIKFPWGKLLGSKTSNYKLTIWREFNSERDTVKPNESTIDNYLQSLINSKEENAE